RNGRREEPPVSGKSAPLFPCSIACSQGKLILETNGGRSPGFRDDRVPFFRFFSVSNGKPILRTTRGRIGIFPPSERFSRRPRTAPRPPPWGRTEGRPGASQRYTVDNPTPADLAAASRDPPRQSSATTARAAGVVNFDGRPPGL